MSQQSTPPERPRAEPEILPPERRDSRGFPPHWASGGREGPYPYGSYRIRVTKLGPFGTIALALGVGVAMAALVMLLLGALAILIPVVGLLVAGAIVAGILRVKFGAPPR